VKTSRYACECAVCKGTKGAAVMTSGRHSACLCDDCRQMVVVMFYCHHDLDKAISETRLALRGKA